MEVRTHIKKIFNIIDQDGNGTLSYDEVQSYAARVGAAGLTGAEQLLGRAFAEEIDTDRDGFVSLKEFAAGYEAFERKLAQLHADAGIKDAAFAPAVQVRIVASPNSLLF